jgi:hypothetical protein
MIPYERYSWREVGCQVANLCSMKLHLAFDALCIRTSLGNCDRKISCLSVHSSARPAAPFCLLCTDTQVYILFHRITGVYCYGTMYAWYAGPLLLGDHSWRLMKFGVWDSIKEDLVLTPQAGAFVLSGLAPADGTVLGCLPPRLLACVRGLITCHQVIILTLTT